MRRANLILNIFEVWIGAAAVLGGAFYFAQPSTLNHTALGHEIGHHLALVWSITYLISGCGILYGLLRPSPRFEIVGLILLGAATAINSLAISSIFGWIGIGPVISGISLSTAAWYRALIVWRSVNKYAAEGGYGE